MPRTEAGQQLDETQTWEERYEAPVDLVKNTLRRYGLLDKRVEFIKGFFNDSLPTAPLGALALIHIDVDAYDSVLDCLAALYPRLQPGGFIVIDDFHLQTVRAAIKVQHVPCVGKPSVLVSKVFRDANHVVQ